MYEQFDCCSLEEALERLRAHEIETNSRFAVYTCTKDFGKSSIHTAKNVYWEDRQSVKTGRMDFCGVPFIVLGTKTFDCQFGKDRKKKAKEKRKALKRQRSSFVYPSLIKRTKKYCICNKGNDGRLYWNCEKCLKWYHPSCLGIDENNEPQFFRCKFCQEPEGDNLNECPGICYEIPEHIMMLDDDEAPKEDDFFINAITACKNMEAAVTRVSLIVCAEKKTRKEPWMGSSNCFRLGGRPLKHGFGYAIFSTQALTCVEYYIRERYFRKDPRKLYSIHGQISGLKDQKLLDMFKEDGILAEIYLTEVLAREGVVAILEHITGICYSLANEECMCTSHKSKLKALKDSILISAAKKEELTKQMDINKKKKGKKTHVLHYEIRLILPELKPLM